MFKNFRITRLAGRQGGFAIRGAMCATLRWSLLAAIMCSPCVLSISEDEYETVRTSNAAILNRLGLIPVLPAAEDGHHRKRLAGPEAFGLRDSSSYGRRHSSGASPHDSHVYIVKLPASAPYYSFAKPHKLLPANVSLAKPGFKNNGKPAKIYHWNLPLVKKINEKKKQMAMAKMDQARKKMSPAERERLKLLEKMSYFKRLAQEQLLAAATESKPSRNNDKWLSEPEKVEPRMKAPSVNATQLRILSSGDKAYRLASEQQERESSRSAPRDEGYGLPSSHNALLLLDSAHKSNKSHKKKSAVSYYYAPALTGKVASTSISKHFPGNGKPKAFYVMEKSRKPIYYHPLLP